MPTACPADSVQRVLVDATKLKTLYCGLGQFTLHLGRTLSQTAGSREQGVDRSGPRSLPPAPCSQLSARPIVPELLVPSGNYSLMARSGLRQVAAYPWKKEIVQRLYRGWLAGFLPPEPRYALWHATTQFTQYLPLDPRTPVLLTIHDLNFLREKPSHICRRNLRRIQAVIDRAAAVTTISHFVANEIRRHLDLRGKPLRVIYNGANTDDYPQAARPEFADARPFLFAISDIVRKKNFHVLVGLIARLPEYRLIIAGNDRTDYAREIRRAAAEAGVAERVCLPGIVSDAARCWLYKNCSGVCFPSLTEGFGLPVVEAMLFGRPVFISDATSLPEVGGPLAFYWKCFDPDAMLAVFRCGMAAYAADPQYAARLTAHAERFSWNKAAAEYLAFYREIIDAGGRLSRRAA